MFNWLDFIYDFWYQFFNKFYTVENDVNTGSGLTDITDFHNIEFVFPHATLTLNQLLLNVAVLLTAYAFIKGSWKILKRLYNAVGRLFSK